MTSALHTAALCLGLSACVPPNDPEVLPRLDHAMFVQQVAPVLERRCSNPSCHGNDSRPLRVYAPEHFRMDAARLHLIEPLTGEELARNEASASAFAVDIARADDSLLLTKAIGLTSHLGGVVYRETTDPEYQAVRAWLQSGGLR
ncbi:MAG: hypothetical protein WCJ30_14575 [Deltaproteobacteria bacterium]